MLGVLVCGYMGVYLCRKNLAVAVPLLVTEFHATREQVGRIASAGTLAYAAGKLLLSPVVDRFGSRHAFLVSLALVAGFGGLSAISPSIGLLGLVYACNRFAASPAWASMVKQTATWFEPRRLPFALGVLSLSYVFGGAAAVALAGVVADLSGHSWQAILLVPAVLLAGFALMSWWVLPERSGALATAAGKSSAPSVVGLFRDLMVNRDFWVICGLSFALTLVRETFNDWSVDFIKSEAGPEVSLRVASFLALPFDICGATGIILTGVVLTRISPRFQRWFIAANLVLLTASLLLLPHSSSWGLYWTVALVGLVGFCGLGPYSLLAGYFSVRLRGEASAGTISGIVDSVGYLAGVLAGAGFGWILDHGGYPIGFRVLSGVALVAAVLTLLLPTSSHHTGNA